MNTVSFTFHGKPHQLSAPSSWNEITPFQLSAWILALQSNLPESEKLKLAVPIFYSIRPNVYKQIPEHYLIQWAPALRFLFEENRLGNWLHCSVKLSAFKRLYGPADMLSNITAYEFFSYTESLYWSYKAEPLPETLNALIAVLYREKRTGEIDNDIRCRLTDAGVAKRAKQLRKLPMHLRLAILYNYEGCRNSITARFKKAFSAKDGKGSKMSDVTLSLAGDKLGDLQHTRNTNLYDFLKHLESLIEQEEKLKQNS